MDARRARRQGGQQTAAAGGAPAAVAPPPAPPQPAPWRLTSHPSSPGEWYYYNTETGATQWEPPAEARPTGAGAWRQVEHVSTGEVYFYNDVTNETSWEAPPGFKDEEVKTEAKPKAKA